MYLELLIAEMRDQGTLKLYEETFARDMVPLVTDAPGLRSAHFGTETGGSRLAVVIFVWSTREAAVAWLSSREHRAIVSRLRQHILGDVVTKFFRLVPTGAATALLN